MNCIGIIKNFKSNVPFVKSNCIVLFYQKITHFLSKTANTDLQSVLHGAAFVTRMPDSFYAMDIVNTMEYNPYYLAVQC